MNTHANRYPLKFSSLKAPSSETIVFVCAGVINLLYMLLYIPDGFRTIVAYPANLGILLMVNASVMFILWLDKRHYGRSIACGFLLPFVWVVAVGIFFGNGQVALAQAPQASHPIPHVDQAADIKPPEGLVVSGIYGTVGQEGWYTSPITITYVNGPDASLADGASNSITLSQQGINKIDVSDGVGGHAKQIF